MKKTNYLWLALEAIDTLTFRGGEAMTAGESHEAISLFPPLPATLIGALRTALLVQNDIEPAAYLAEPESFARRLPLLGLPEEPGFQLIGPFFLLQGEIFFPAPGHWFREKGAGPTAGKEVRIEVAVPLREEFAALGLAGSVARPFWVHHPQISELDSLNGCLINAAALAEAGGRTGFSLNFAPNPEAVVAGRPTLLECSAVYDYESRMGIALDPGLRRVREGHLYASQHVRLRDGVELVAALAAADISGLAADGILQLGGEQRICRYRTLGAPDFAANPDGGLLMALSPVACEGLPPAFAEAPRAGGRLLRLGGWDLRQGFHKPTTAYYPAGTVFQVEDRTVNPEGFLRLS